MHRRLAPALLLASCLTVSASMAGQPAGVERGPALGWTLDADSAERLPPLPEPSAKAGPIVSLLVDWGRIESEPGVYDWTLADRAIEALRAGGYRVVLRLSGTHPDYPTGAGLPSPAVPGSLEGWLGFVAGAVRSFAGRVEVYQVGDWVGGDPAEYAFLLKQSALAIRAQAQSRQTTALVAQASIRADQVDLQRELWSRDVAAYIDLLPLGIVAGTQPGAAVTALETWARESLSHPPAPGLWARIQPASDGLAEAAAVVSLAAGASAALLEDSSASADSFTERARWIIGAQSALAEGYAPAPLGSIGIEGPDGAPWPDGAALGRFFNERDFSTLVFFLAPAAADPETRPRVSLDGDLRNTRLLDPIAGTVSRIASQPRSGQRTGRVVTVPGGNLPAALRFEHPAATPGFEIPPEDLDVRSKRGLTAEEIIARHQQVQREQDDRLERWTARGRVDFHFKLVAGGSTVDVSIDSNYFWERGGQLEWEQTDYYINGNKVRWKNIPELPLIQPEKVITLPLDLTLDRTYVYRLVNEERVGDREAYVLEFQPGSPDAPLSLYRGRVWIDRATFVRLKASVIQTQLESPVLSNEEVDRYLPQTDGGSQDFWMLSAIDGQQTWSAAGRTFVVRRELSFRDFEINPPRTAFEELRGRAYASRNQMLRDTEQGFRYLERQDDGTRTVKQGVDTSQLLAGGGAFRDSSTDGVTPLGGVNYFNYDLWGRKIQLNAFFAGVLGFFTASKPDLFGANMDATVDAGISLIKFEDKVFDANDEKLEQRLDNRVQNVSMRLGIPAGQFFKMSLVGGLTVREYFESSDASRALEQLHMQPGLAGLTFVLPEDHLQLSATMEAEFNRRGYTVRAEARVARRSDWEEWGLFDQTSGSFGRLDSTSMTFVPGSPAPVRDRFSRWGVTLFKEWYLPKFQKLRGEVNYLDGADLDRFSQYQFSLFGEDRLNGFSGSGVRFDDGMIYRAGYSFNLFEVIRLDATLDSARVRDAAASGRQAFTGVGVAANVVGPWKTVISASYGRALASDVAELEGEQEFLLLVLKLF